MLQGGRDLLLELLQHTWTRLPSDLYREIQAQAGAVAPSGTGTAMAMAMAMGIRRGASLGLSR